MSDSPLHDTRPHIKLRGQPDCGRLQRRHQGAHGEPVPPDVRDGVRALIEAKGEPGVVEYLGVSRQTLARLAAGLPVRRGTLAQVAASGVPGTRHQSPQYHP